MPSNAKAASLADLISEPRLGVVGPKLVRQAREMLGGAEIVLLLEDRIAGGRRSSDPTEVVRRFQTPGLTLEAETSLEALAGDATTATPGECRLIDPASVGVPRKEKPSAIVSLRFGETPVGTLLAAEVDPAVWDVGDVTTFAAGAAIALENAGLFETQEARARQDPLTGLLNHREFHEALSRELHRGGASGQGFALVLLDLDDFKVVNDSSGHAAGDRLLTLVATRLREACRQQDEAFRIGGDEFALIVRTPDNATAERVALAAASTIESERRRAGISYGVSLWPHDGPGRDALLRKADSELYAMKRRRKPARGAVVPPGANANPKEAGLQRERLEVARRLATMLSHARTEADIARIAVEQLHHSFAYYLAVVQRLDPDGTLRMVAAEGPLTEGVADFLAINQSIDVGVNGRVARTGEAALVQDTSLDPDYLGQGAGTDPLSELSLPIRVAGTIWGVLNLEQVDPSAFSDDDVLLADTVASQIGAAIHRCRLVDELEGAFLTTLTVLADAVEMQDRYTADHARDVADLAVQVGIRMGIGGDELERLRYGALLHDVGKIGVPNTLLRKEGELTPAERETMRDHSNIGARMLERIPFLAPVAPLVRTAHERMDGRGYPDGVSGDEIPRGARIISACDAFDAMNSDRPYRQALPWDEIVRELREGAGTQFDPDVIEALLAEIEREPGDSDG